MTLPANEPSWGRVYLYSIIYIQQEKRFSRVLPTKTTEELNKMPSITIHRYTATLNLHLKSAWQLYARMHRSTVSMKNTIKQKCRRLTRQTSRYQVLSMLNEKFTIIPWVHFMDYTFDMLPPRDWQIRLYKSF